MVEFLKVLTRRQLIRYTLEDKTPRSTNNSTNEPNTNRLEKKLTLSSLIFLNVSNTIGSGIYILTGMAANIYSGPYVSLSYLISGIACFFSMFCFAEFSARIKSASGSSYSFIYYSLGEFVAFFIGWMVFMGSVASIAATSLTWSSYLDSTTNYAIKNFTVNTLHASWNLSSPFNNYLDIPAILVLIILFSISLHGLNISTPFNNTFAILNLILLAIISISGFVFGDFNNLTKTPYKNGFEGVIQSASIVTYAFIGFESSTFAIDETLNPARNVPLSMIISLALVGLAYFGSSFSLILMQPFDQLDLHAPYPVAFKTIKFMYWIVSIGPIVSLTGSLLSSIFSIARIAYNMSKDGLLFKYLSNVNKKTEIPDLATITSLIVSLILVVIVDVKGLIGFADVSSFLIYSLIAVALLVVRYFHDDAEVYDNIDDALNNNEIVESSFVKTGVLNESQQLLNDTEEEDLNISINNLNIGIINSIVKKKTNMEKLRDKCYRMKFFQNKFNALAIIFLIFFSNLVCFGLINKFHSIKLFILPVFIIINLGLAVLLSLFKQSKMPSHMSFKVPFCPFIPVLVIISNSYLLMACELKEFIIFGIVLALGIPIYLFYGLRHSKLGLSGI